MRLGFDSLQVHVNSPTDCSHMSFAEFVRLPVVHPGWVYRNRVIWTAPPGSAEELHFQLCMQTTQKVAASSDTPLHPSACFAEVLAEVSLDLLEDECFDIENYLIRQCAHALNFAGGSPTGPFTVELYPSAGQRLAGYKISSGMPRPVSSRA